MQNVDKGSADDRRSSVRVRSMLPCLLRPIGKDEIEAMEARILDMAVIESDGIVHEVPDWAERTDEIQRDFVFLLNELRALRQQVTELSRLVELHGQSGMEPRWLVINDRGLWVPMPEAEHDWSPGDHCEVRLQIPSIHTPEIIAVGEVIRIDDEESTTEDGAGIAILFRYISQAHSKAIIRYALRRERQLARSVRFH